MAESFLSGKREVWEERRKKTQSGARAEVFSRHGSEGLNKDFPRPMITIAVGDQCTSKRPSNKGRVVM